MKDQGLDPVAVLVGGLVGVLGVVWAGLQLSVLVTGGGPVRVGVGDVLSAVVALPGIAGEPSAVWPEGVAGVVPGPWVFWPCVGLVLVGVGLGAWWVWRLVGGSGRVRVV